MKTTIEIADDLFERAQRLARKEGTTFGALTEQGSIGIAIATLPPVP